MKTLAKYHVCSHFVIGENTFKNTGLSCPASYRDFRETDLWGLFLESPGNLPGPRSIFVNIFFAELHSEYRHDTWPKFSSNYKILKFSIQS